MKSYRGKALFRASLGFALSMLSVAAPASSAPTPAQEEAKARQACENEAKTLNRKLPPGTCEDPRSSFRANMRARELCQRSSSVMQGTLKCRRDIVPG